MRAYCSVGDIYFSFRHEQFPKFVAGPHGLYEVKAFTMCSLQLPTRTCHATVWCHVADNFSKEVGRKLALKKAMKEADLSRDDRREVWMAYFGRKNHAKWPNLHLGEGFGYNSWEAAI